MRAAMAELTCLDLGRSSYADALDLQQRLVALVRRSPLEAAYLILTEHFPPAITLGVSASQRNVLVAEATLAAAGIELHHARRGGDVTYHGPGQLVGYPILRVDLHGKSLRLYVRQLEEVLIRALSRMGVPARREQGLTGVWVGVGKVAAIGVAVSRWVSYHGFAVNVAPNMRHFEMIVPCGLHGVQVTCLAETTGGLTVNDLKQPIVESMVEVFGFSGFRPAGRTFQRARAFSERTADAARAPRAFRIAGQVD